jgi:hypothetical protein
MTERPFRRVVLICDAASDIRPAVAEAAALAARWGAPLHGIFLDDENLRRFAALPFSQYVSLSSAEVTEEFTAAAMASLASALGAAMKRVLGEVAKAEGLEWTFGAIRDLRSAASLAGEEGDTLVVEAASRAFSGAWRPRAAWEKSPADFTGTVLLKGRAHGARGILVLLPEDAAQRERVIAASAALAADDEQVVLAGKSALLPDAEAALAQYLDPAQRRRIATLPLDEDHGAVMRYLARRNPALIVLDAEDAGDWLDEAKADLLLVR